MSAVVAGAIKSCTCHFCVHGCPNWTCPSCGNFCAGLPINYEHQGAATMALKPIPVEDRKGSPEERKRAYDADMKDMQENPLAWNNTAPLPLAPGERNALNADERAELKQLREAAAKKNSETERAELEKLRQTPPSPTVRAQMVRNAAEKLRAEKKEGTLTADGIPKMDPLREATGLTDLTQDERDKALA